MSSPAKKRKLNSDGKQKPTPAKGLEYFFAKQRQNGSSSNTPSSHEAQDGTAQSEHADGSLTDEELAKKLQAEWDAEVRGSSSRSSPRPEPDEAGADAGTPASRKTHTPLDPGLPPSGRVLQSAKVKNTLSLSSAAATEDEITASLPLNESPLVFEPSKYITQLQSSWAAEGGDASYALLTRCFVLVNGTQSRIKIVDTLVNCIRLLIEGDPASLLPAVWLATNAISPPYISMELGLGGSAISKALKQACGLDSRALKALYDKVGDPGDVAFEAKKKQSFTLRKPKPLSIKGVFQSLVKISQAQGQGSGDIKQRIVDRLLQDSRGGEESRYIVRTLCQHVKFPRRLETTANIM
jgi:DNA ligase-1